LARTLSNLMLIGLALLAVLALGLASPAGRKAGEALKQITWTTAGSHAVSHSESDVVRNCQPGYRIVVRTTKYVDICAMDKGWGFRPWLKTGGPNGAGETWSELTAYQKAKVQSAEDLQEYVARNNANTLMKAWKLYKQVDGTWVEVEVR
jgi:hypothetical protein